MRRAKKALPTALFFAAALAAAAAAAARPPAAVRAQAGWTTAFFDDFSANTGWNVSLSGDDPDTCYGQPPSTATPGPARSSSATTTAAPPSCAWPRTAG